MKPLYVVSIELTVHDEEELFKAAFEYAVDKDKQDPDYAVGYLRPDGEVDAGACLQTLLDPGSLPGCEIQHSSAEGL